MKRGMSQREKQGEVIEIDDDIPSPGALNQTQRTVSTSSIFSSLCLSQHRHLFTSSPIAVA